MSLQPERLVFLDIETTGLSAKTEKITEIAALVYEEGKLIQTFSTLVNPKIDIPYHITNITGITNSMVQNAPTFQDIAKELRGLLFDKIFIAHNAQFDYGFIKEEYRRLDHDFREVQLCTAKLSRRLYPENRRHNLDEIIRICGIECEKRHRAHDDAKVLIKFYEMAKVSFPDEIFQSAWERSLTRLK
jgi:DNA polymerase III subunit epsilon